MRFVKSQSQSKLIPDRRSSNNLKVHPLLIVNAARDSSEVILQSEAGCCNLESVNSLRIS